MITTKSFETKLFTSPVKQKSIASVLGCEQNDIEDTKWEIHIK